MVFTERLEAYGLIILCEVFRRSCVRLPSGPKIGNMRSSRCSTLCMDAVQSLLALTLVRMRTVGGLTFLLMAPALPLLRVRQGPYTFSPCAAKRRSRYT